MPKKWFELGENQPAATIYVQYLDANGDRKGPFPIRFEPVAELERFQRKTLEDTSGAWVALQEGYNSGLLLYFSHLISYRCGIREVRYGLNSAVPDKTFQLPACSQKDPYSAPIFIKVPDTTKQVSVELTYRDGSVSQIKTFSRKQ
jgi:hypothetical protein